MFRLPSRTTTRWRRYGPSTPLRRAAGAVAIVTLLPVVAACASADAGKSSSSSAGTPVAAASSGARLATARTLRLGYFANVTHATAVVGASKQEPFFRKALGGTTLKTSIFNAGPAAIEAMQGGSLDAAYLGPNPAINGYAKSHGTLLRIVAGATSGGAALVVKRGITAVAQLKGAKLATPQLGGTQDVALRAFLRKHGLAVPVSGKGDVSILNLENATTLQQFQSGAIDGAWLPEPWASRLVVEGGGHVLVDERTLWPAGKFVTTHLVVSQAFLRKYPGTVKELIQGEIQTNNWITAHPAQAKTVVNDELARLSGKPLKAAVLDSAWKGISVTADPLAESLKQSAQNAVDAGLLKQPDLTGIYDLSLLNEVLNSDGKSSVSDAGYGVGAS